MNSINQRSTLVSVNELYTMLNTVESVCLVDCRFKLGDPNDGRKRYLKNHIRDAVYLDLETDLSGQIKEHGGRHPLPDVRTFVQTLGHLGINESTTVIAYDDEGGAFASRLWWLMKFVGHTKVHVLNGGYSEWTNRQMPINDVTPEREKKVYQANIQPDMLATKEDVLNVVHSGGATLLDSREEKRYKGIEEPIDKVAGRIPGAKHLYWGDNLTRDGLWITEDLQRSRLNYLDKDDKFIIYCGSGVTACPNILALQSVGFKQVKLYAGSWSDWITYPDTMYETNKDDLQS
ncbi:sulfurtransferase [Bacillus sp. FJAT-45037]|uniref:sulfurtransferase n=1 Tax=Bacillus sp. FJAT-45037 TaxID=2011007 RepID=UPI000C2441AF|nr:sulfurtransferase [Bacillus sp. FJAT-45037]